MKCNADSSKLIKTVDHLARCFRKMMLNTPTFANIFDTTNARSISCVHK